MDLITFMKSHFFHVAPIVLVGIIGAAIILERMKALFMTYPMNNTEFLNQVSQMIMSVKVNEAVYLCDNHPNKLLPKIVKSALTRANMPEVVIQDGIQISLQECVQALMKRTAFLGTIANVATLLGLFGTIAGLIQSFEAVGFADAQQKTALLSAGIGTAMNATMIGLAVAIPCILAYSFLMNKSNQMIADLERAAVQVNDMLRQRFYASEFLDMKNKEKAKK